MKYLIQSGLITCLLLITTACGGSSQTPPTDTSATEDQTVATQTLQLPAKLEVVTNENE